MAWLLSSVAFILTGKLQVSQPDPEDQPDKNPVPVPAQRRQSLVQDLSLELGTGFLPAETHRDRAGHVEEG